MNNIQLVEKLQNDENLGMNISHKVRSKGLSPKIIDLCYVQVSKHFTGF